MQKAKVLVIIGIVIAALLAAGCTQSPGTSANATVVILYTNPGQMPQLLATDQIDGYMAWQPFVSVGVVTGLAQLVSYSQNLPPPEIWADHSCDSLVARDAVVQGNPELTDALSAALIAATNYTQDNPNRTAEISADWIFGGQDLTFGNVTVSSVDVEKASIPTIRFTNTPSPQWLESNILFIDALKDIGYVSGTLSNVTPEETNALLYNFGPLEDARAMLAAGTIVTPEGPSQKISIGYLLSDHDSPLFVALKEWRYFNDTYGVALKPVTESTGRVQNAELLVNGKKVADVQLVQGDGGAQLMTLMASNSIDFAIAGTPPTISSIDKGTPIKILFPIHTEGSGLVVKSGAPVTGWDSFITWIKEKSSGANPVKIAVAPKGSIQDVQLKYALEQSGVTVIESK
jgi:ABC-type nitrate/sulfonate/bicarbonate transport system substrate-binding protein